MVEQLQLADWMMGWPADFVVGQAVDWVGGLWLIGWWYPWLTRWGIRSGERGGGRGLIESPELELGDMNSDAGWLFVEEVCLSLCEEAESPLAVVIT